jgi:hypothetical protein
MTTKIKIETGIPISRLPSKWAEMQEAVNKLKVGQSFVWVGLCAVDVNPRIPRTIKKDRKFVCRTINNHQDTRVWRIE